MVTDSTSECLDHLIVLGERHLRAILAEIVRYYNEGRGHQSLRDAPIHRATIRKPATRVLATPILGGLHHTYAAA